MQYFHPAGLCRNCHSTIPERGVPYSIFRLGYPLCASCEDQLQQKLLCTAEETILLYFALRSRMIPAELEKINSRNRFDITVSPVRINIEVSALYQQKKEMETVDGYLTLGIPDYMVRNNLGEVTSYIEAIVKENFNNVLV